MENVTQSAQGHDGTPKGMPAGQSNKIEQMNNPKGMTSLKESRNTGEIKQGSDFLRKNQNGVK